MALVNAPFGTNEFLGSVGSTTFQRGPSGLVARTRSIPVNPNTGPQNQVRTNLSVISFAWQNILTPALRQVWNNYAQDTPMPNRFGINRNIGGRNHFIRTNTTRFLISLPLDQTAPLTPGVANMPTFILTADTTAGLEIDAISPAIAAGDWLSIRLSSAQNQTKNYFSSPFRFAVALDSTVVPPFQILPGSALTIGTRIFLRFRYLQVDGKVSFDSQFSVDIDS